MSSILTGQIIAKRQPKTATVAVDRIRVDPIYKKSYRLRKKLLVHDPDDVAIVGQTVRIKEIAPVSKRKNWIVVN